MARLDRAIRGRGVPQPLRAPRPSPHSTRTRTNPRPQAPSRQPGRGPVGGIFISYRRDDSQAWARGLYDALRRAFGPSRVFRDIDTLEAGVDYAEAIEQWLARSAGVLVVLGPPWLAA